MGESLLYQTVESGIPLLEITVRFVLGVDYSRTTIEFNLLGDDIHLDPRDWYDDPRLRVGSATAEALYRLFGWKVRREKLVLQNPETGKFEETNLYCWKDVEPWARTPPSLDGKIENMGYSQPGAYDDGQWYKPNYT